jgi:hypothetical protein
MKRSSPVKKLALSRETLRRLSDQALLEVAGGAKTDSCQWSDCDTCGIICSTPLASCTCPIG